MSVTAPADGVDTQPATPGVYVVRDDLNWATRGAALDTFRLRRAKSDLTRALSGRTGHRVRVVTLHETDAALATAATRLPVISLDVASSGADGYLHLSRTFDVGGHQSCTGPVAARPGYPPLQEQLATLAARFAHKRCILVDDDISTGATTRAGAAALHSCGVTVTEVRSLIADVVGEPIVDVVDARDFFIGTRDAGLVVGCGGRRFRVPYLAPYVNLASRATIESALVEDLNAELWALNAELWADNPATISELDAGFVALLRDDGWDDTTTLADFSAAQPEVLRRRSSRATQQFRGAAW